MFQMKKLGISSCPHIRDVQLGQIGTNLGGFKVCFLFILAHCPRLGSPAPYVLHKCPPRHFYCARSGFICSSVKKLNFCLTAENLAKKCPVFVQYLTVFASVYWATATSGPVSLNHILPDYWLLDIHVLLVIYTKSVFLQLISAMYLTLVIFFIIHGFISLKILEFSKLLFFKLLHLSH